MIRLSKLTDYAFVALHHIVVAGPDKVHAAKDVAGQIGLPLPTVSKILKSLARKGFLKAHRGMKGGYSLARPSSEMSIAEIVTALDGPIALTDCLTGSPVTCLVENCCRTKGRWAKVNAAIQRALENVSLADLAPASEQAQAGDGGGNGRLPTQSRQLAAAEAQNFEG